MLEPPEAVTCFQAAWPVGAAASAATTKMRTTLSFTERLRLLGSVPE